MSTTVLDALVAAGRAAGQDGAVLLTYDPATGRWTAAVALLPPRTRHRWHRATGSTPEHAMRELARAIP